MGRFTGFLGLAVILGVAWLCSSHKKEIKLRLILWGMGLQFAFALLVLKTDFGRIFQAASTGVNAMLNFAQEGSRFLFGDKLGAANDQFGVIFAFQVLPIVIVMGQTEAPLTIKPFLAGLTESELFTIMTAGMAHVSGAVMAAYVKVAGVSIIHLLTAVIMTAPATIMLAKIFIPEPGKPVTAGRVDIKVEKTAVNVIDAAAQGAGDGLHLALNIGGMLIAFLALIAMCNGILGWLHTLPLLGWLPASLERIFGIVFAPVAFILGVPWKDCGV